jgi:hypothetical protein
MKQKLLSLLAFMALTLGTQAQQFVYETPGTKHALIEEFTGVNCGNCPAGHTIVANILVDNPGKAHVIAYSPTNSNFTNPTSGATDFRRSFADAFYTSSYCSPGDGSRYMPSAFINRTIGADGNILQGRTVWESMVNTALAETADLNVAVKSNYDATAQTLTIDVETFNLSAISNPYSVYVLLTEDDLTSDRQSGSSATASNPYVYKHTFRENISTGQWGDVLTSAASAASDLNSKQYVYNLTSAQDPIDVSKAHIVAFIVDANTSTFDVLNSISTEADGGFASTGGAPTATIDLAQQNEISIYPNPSTGDVFIDLANVNDAISIKVTDLLGKTVHTQEAKANSEVKLNKNIFPAKGIYSVQLGNAGSAVTQKLVIK